MLCRTLGKTQEQVSAIGLGGLHLGIRDDEQESIRIIRSAIECLHYALNLPTSVVITGIDSVEILNQAIQAAETFKPMTAEEVTKLLSRTAQITASGQCELFKTDNIFDATAINPDWLGVPAA